MGATGLGCVATRDARGRALRDLRISVTDRCNFRCTYCMPADRFGPGHRFLSRDRLLRPEELETVARAAVGLGVEKIRLTGGEPLLRPEIVEIVGRLARIRGLSDLALTTNGSRLEALAPALADAGLGRVTVSLDALDDETFGRMNGVGAKVTPVLAGIEAAVRAGLRPVKVNMVVRKGLNEAAIEPMAARFRGTGIVLRFIEFMDVGETNGWTEGQVVPAAAIVERIDRAVHPVRPVAPAFPGEVARRWAYTDGSGEIGIVASVSQPFCGACTRLRLAADGTLYTCLFATAGHDLRPALQVGESEVTQLLRGIWSRRNDQYSAERSSPVGATAPSPAGPGALPGALKVEMSRVGG